MKLPKLVSHMNLSEPRRVVEFISLCFANISPPSKRIINVSVTRHVDSVRRKRPFKSFSLQVLFDVSIRKCATFDRQVDDFVWTFTEINFKAGDKAGSRKRVSWLFCATETRVLLVKIFISNNSILQKYQHTSTFLVETYWSRGTPQLPILSLIVWNYCKHHSAQGWKLF